jgi:RimJ/RimL family protein N-acetyltransferase
MQREFPKTKFVGIVKTENTASRRVFERLGFTPGPYKDHAGAMRYVRLASNGGASGK